MGHRVAELRRALMDAVSEEDVRTLAGALLNKAKGGDVAAARLILPYLVGPPPDLDPELEARLEALEGMIRATA